MRALVMLAAAVVPGLGLSQPLLEPGSDDVERRLIESIQDEQLRNGLDSPSLIDSFTALALLYEEGGDRGPAIAALEQARAIVRVNYGLYSLEEAPLIRESMLIEEARGNVEAAWGHEQRLLELAARHPGDLRSVHILREASAARLDILRRYRAGELPYQIVLGCYYRSPQRGVPPAGALISNGQGCRSGAKSTVEARLRREAAVYDWTATYVILQHELYTSGNLGELAMEVERTCRLYRRNLPEACDDERRVVAALGYDVGSSVAQVDALVRKADQHITNLSCWPRLRDPTSGAAPNDGTAQQACNGAEEAFAMYEQAYEQLRREGVAQSSIDRVFSPQIPVVLPVFGRKDLLSEETPASTGYIDVAFNVTKSGRAEQIEILDKSGDVSRAARFALVRTLARSIFRPRAEDGRLANASPVVVRYYVQH